MALPGIVYRTHGPFVTADHIGTHHRSYPGIDPKPEIEERKSLKLGKDLNPPKKLIKT